MIGIGISPCFSRVGPLGKVATPTFSPDAGSYGSTQSVTISTVTPGASLFYTTDGSTPDANSTPVSGAVSVAASETLKAIGIKAGYSDSAIGSAAYVISAAVTFDPAKHPTQITLSGANLIATCTVDADVSLSDFKAGSSASVASGKVYCEFESNGGAFESWGFGFALSTFDWVLSDSVNYLGGTADSWVYYPGDGTAWTNGAQSSAPGIGSGAPGQVGQLAIDDTLGKAWVGVDDAWDGNPALGLNPTFTFTPGTLFVGISAGWNGSISQARFKASAFTKTKPVGFSALDPS